jgi:hypothetical protein
MYSKCTCGKMKKTKHTLCRQCFIGPVAFAEEKTRLKLVRAKRHCNRSWRKRHFECEMRYSDCEARGYCNGDC